MSDLTLLEALEDDDITELGKVEDSEKKDKVARYVDKMLEVAKDKAQTGIVDNNFILFGFKWTGMRNATVLPVKYRNEHTISNILNAVLKISPQFKLPPSKFMYSTADVIPTGVIFNCATMEHEAVNKIIRSAPLMIVGKIKLVPTRRDGDDGEEEPIEQLLKVKALPYARRSEEYVWSVCIDKPMYKAEVEDGYVLNAPSSKLMETVFEIWGEPIYRTEKSIRDDYYLADDDMLISGTHKNRYTAFYKRPPTCPVPPFYSLEDSNGKVVATWSVRTRCYNLDVYNVCEDCRFPLTGTDPNEEHDCIHSGNFDHT